MLDFCGFLTGSGGWIRTSDQLINSQLRYHCATPERGENSAYYIIFLFDAQGGIFTFFTFFVLGRFPRRFCRVLECD